MELTGKCKVDFEKWYNIEYDKMHVADVCSWSEIPKSMQFGVLVDFFDRIGINIDIQPIPQYDSEKYTRIGYFEVIVIELNKTTFTDSIGSFNTRPEARIEAIEKANEIYNDKQKDL